MSPRFAFGIFFFCLSFQAHSQDPHFTQFYANPLYTNPATTGVTYSENGGRVGLNYRNQWQSRYVTTAAFWDQEFKKLKGGLGLMLMSDATGEGLFTTRSFSALYSFKQKIKEKLTLNYGLQFERFQKSFRWSSLRFEESYDTSIDFIDPTKEPYLGLTAKGPNFSAGVLAHHPNFFVGVALHNIIEPNVSVTGEPHNVWPRRLTIHGGYNFEFENAEKWQVSPRLLFMQQKQFQQINGGILASYAWFTFGTFYRQAISNASDLSDIIGVLGVRTKKWRFAYSYDKVISEAAQAMKGSHEVSLGFAYCRKKTSTEMHKGVMW